VTIFKEALLNLLTNSAINALRQISVVFSQNIFYYYIFTTIFLLSHVVHSEDRFTVRLDLFVEFVCFITAQCMMDP